MVKAKPRGPAAVHDWVRRCHRRLVVARGANAVRRSRPLPSLSKGGAVSRRGRPCRLLEGPLLARDETHEGALKGVIPGYRLRFLKRPSLRRIRCSPAAAILTVLALGSPVTSFAADPCTGNTRFLVGSGVYDITGPAAEVGMMGYAQVGQKTSGIHQRLRSRAFVIASPCNGKRVAFVSADRAARWLFASIESHVLPLEAPRYHESGREPFLLVPQKMLRRPALHSRCRTQAAPGGGTSPDGAAHAAGPSSPPPVPAPSQLPPAEPVA